MREFVTVYLSGSVRKGQSDNRNSFWDAEDIDILRASVHPLQCAILDPSSRSDDLADFQATFGRDLCQVACSDCVLVDGRDRRGLGVGAEMVFAKAQVIPVISIVPVDSHYHRRNFTFMGQELRDWIHPFVWGLSDALVSEIPDAGKEVVRLTSPGVHIKGLDECYAAIQHYLGVGLGRDIQMLRILQEFPELRSRTAELNALRVKAKKNV